MSQPLNPDHSKAISVIHVLAHNRTGYMPTEVRFGMVNYSPHGSIYVQLRGDDRTVLHYTATCHECEGLLRAFFGSTPLKDRKGYPRWSFHLPPGVLSRVEGRLKHIYWELSKTPEPA